MQGDEERVVAAYADWLEDNGWAVRREVDFADIYAERGDERLYAEAKGRTAAIGLDVDVLYGQLLHLVHVNREPVPNPGLLQVLLMAADLNCKPR